jgi:hypothetical protein
MDTILLSRSKRTVLLLLAENARKVQGTGQQNTHSIAFFKPRPARRVGTYFRGILESNSCFQQKSALVMLYDSRYK